MFGAYVDAPWLDHTDTLPPSKHYTFDTCRNDAAIGMDLIKDVDDDGWRLPYEDYPFATCELGSGLPASYIRRPFVSPMDAYALSLVKLGCGNNLVGYYMYHGGTNKIGKLSTLHESKATGYPNDYAILNYDFQTCIGEYGQIRDQYKLLNLIHLFFQIKSFFRKNCGLVSNLCMADTVNPKSVNVKKVICLTGQPFGQLAFLNHIRYSYFEEHPMSLQIYSLNNHLLRSNFN